MTREIISKTAKSIDLEKRLDSFLEKLTHLDQKSTAFSNTITTEKRFLKSHYPALRTYSKRLGIYRARIADSLGFHYSYEETRIKLLKKYPHLEAVICGATASEVILKVKNHIKILSHTDTQEITDLSNLKIASKAYYSLKLQKGERLAISRDDTAKVEAGKSDKIEVSIHLIKKAVNEGLSSESMYKQAVALTLCIGRRPVELFKTAAFTKSKVKGEVIFSGQAKDKGTGVRDHYSIPVHHITVEEFLTAFKAFRKNTTGRGYDQLTNEQVNNRISSELSGVSRKMLMSDRVKFYTCRHLYAHYAVKTAKPKDEQKYIAKILGHGDNDSSTARSYEKVFIIDTALSDIKYESIQREHSLPLGVKDNRKTKKPDTRRAKRFEALTGEVQGMGKAIRNIHQWACEHVAQNPSVTLTQTYITKNQGSSRPAIAKYIEFIGELAAGA